MKRLCSFFVFLFLLSLVAYGQNTLQENVAELERRLTTAWGKEKVDTLNELILILYKNRSPRTIELCQQSWKLAEEIGYDKGKARAFIFLANTYRSQGKIKEPFDFGRKALQISRRLRDPEGTVDALNTLGFLYKSIDNYEEALKYLVEALEICDSLGIPLKMSGIYYQVGSVYLRLEDDKKAMGYFQDAYKIAEGIGDRRLMATYLNNIGNAHRGLEQYNEALDCFKRVLSLAEEIKQSHLISAATFNIGINYGDLGDTAKALEYLEKTLILAEKSNNRKRVSDVLMYMGMQYFELGKLQQAKNCFREASGIALEIQDNSGLQYIYANLSDLYVAENDYITAMAFYKKSVDVKDQLINSRKSLQMMELQERYEAEKREKEIGFLKKNSEIHRLTRNLLIAGFVLLAVLLAFILKKYMYLFAFWKKEKYIGQYRLIKTIGAGGMSTVYLAHGIKDKTQIVAIKVLKEEYYLRESHRRRFKLEGTIIDKLYHPNIIKIFERGEDNERLFIIMEYIEGRSLVDVIDEGALPLDQCLVIMKQVTAALVFIHGKNIIHRDLKPGNIMVKEKDGQVDAVKLLDFGLSKMKFQSRITMTGVLVGTASYMAPEQITDLESTTASDIFSLGLIFYEMLTGRAAFPGETISRIESQILDAAPATPVELRPGVPAELNELIMQMLAKKPGQRPSAETVSQRLSV